jgi:hypothetical protein
MFILSLSSLALLAGCAGRWQLKPSDGSAGPIAVSISNTTEDSWPGRPGDIGWAVFIEAQASITPKDNKVDGVLETIKITANPRSKSGEWISSYTVCLAFELDSGQWDTWRCSGLRVVNKALESGSSFSAENVRFSIPAGRQPSSDNYWLVITVHSPNRDYSAFVHAHSRRGILVRQNAER